VIKVNNLVKKYNGNIAVDHINFTIEKGQIVGFLGPNGAGKSTTMNIITGYISATEGNVTIDGHDVLKEPEKAKKNIGYLPEIPPLYTDMTVCEYLRFVAKLKRMKFYEVPDVIEDVMQKTQISHMADRLIRNLSKGYRQRVGLAGALIGKPEVLILDEPSVGLDPQQIIQIRTLLKSLAKEHTVILSSHVLSEISAVCDRVIIINHGQIVMDDMIDNLNKNVKDSECLKVTAKTSKSNIEKIVKSVKGVVKTKTLYSKDKGCVDIEIYSDGKDIREDIYNAIVKNNIVVLEMAIKQMSLEDVYLEAIKEESAFEIADLEEKKKKKEKSNKKGKDKVKDKEDKDKEEKEVKEKYDKKTSKDEEDKEEKRRDK